MSNTLSLADRLPQPLPPEPQGSSGLNFHDLIFIFYRHKWKISSFILGGIAAAALVYVFMPAPFESQSKLLVRYVVERSAVDNVEGQVSGKDKGDAPPLGAPSEEILNSEVEILTSSDLALQVAETIGPRRLLEASPSPLHPLLVALHLRNSNEKLKVTVEDAAIAIRQALEVKAITGSNIISVTYRNKDAKLAVEVLDQIVHRYLEKHLEIHRSLAGYEFVSREAEQLRIELGKTEDDLKDYKEKYGITTLAETLTTIGAELTSAQTAWDVTQSDLATQRAHVAEIDKFFHGENIQSSSSSEVVAPPDTEIINHYQALVGQVDDLRKKQSDLLGRYAAGSKMTRTGQARLEALEKQKIALEKKYPALITTVVASGGSSSSATATTNDIILERARLAGLETRAVDLKARVRAIQQRLQALNSVAPKIAELERKKDVEEQSYRYYGASLEKSHVDQGLNPSRMPNISVVQNPSPAQRTVRDLKKVVIGLAGGSIVIGLALALFIELVLDRTIKRARELEARLQLPLMLTIPALAFAGQGRLRLTATAGAGDPEALAELEGEYLRPFCEAIRDRLGLYFEINQMAHKPKLIAVTGLSKNAGVSTLAAGLADVLSEAGENKVLFVDKPLKPKRFYNLVQECKESNVDYVVFDMPSLGDTSSTLPMAGFMDKLLLVVEAEKSSREAVKRAYAQLSQKTDVSVIFNKSRSYGPKWIEGEL